MKLVALSLSTAIVSAAFTTFAMAKPINLSCAVERYAHAGFKHQGITESWFPKNTTHQLSDGKAVWKETGAGGTYTEGNGRIKISYVLKDTQGTEITVVYTYIRKTGIFTGKMGVMAGYADTSGTTGRCTIK